VSSVEIKIDEAQKTLKQLGEWLVNAEGGVEQDLTALDQRLDKVSVIREIAYGFTSLGDLTKA
jgi:hypothetical protein